MSPGRRGRRAVATLEGLKGAFVLLAGLGAFALVHRDAQALAEHVVRHLHLNPARHAPRVFLEAAEHLDDARLRWLAAGAFAYAGLRLLESWGLFREREWAEWLGALSAALYVPFEIAALASRPSPLKGALLLLNLAVVTYLSGLLLERRRRRP